MIANFPPVRIFSHVGRGKKTGLHMAERLFQGDRTIDGAQVTVDGTDLDPCLGVKSYTDHGFDWSYEGDSPRQLALAILVEHLGNATDAQSLTEDFMTRVVANFGNEWEMTSADIDTAIANIRGTA